jgi:neutral ceramidase
MKRGIPMCNRISRYAYLGIAAIVFASMFSATTDAKAADAPAAIESAKAAWQDGSARFDFVMDEQTLGIKPFTVATDDKAGSDGRVRCILVVPKKATAGNPWSWRDLHRNHQPPAETELLARGFHLAYITPGPLRQRDAWHAFLTEKHRLSRKPVFVGMSTAGGLRAGTAKVSITPEDARKPVHDKVYARSLVLDVDGERLAIVSVDMGIYTSEHLVAVCKERFGISHLVLSSSHTHSDPGRSFSAFYEERLIQVMETAVNNMFPARISAGHRSFPQLGFNRLVVRDDGHARESWFGDDHYTSENPERIPFGPVDPEVGVIKIEDLKGQPRAILMNYACHADVVCQNYAISADYPGAATRKVEEAFGNNLNCLFVQGAGGNIESLIISSRRTGPEDPFQTDYSTIERVGGLLAYETIKLAKSLSPSARKETTIRYMNDSLKFSGRFDKNAAYDVHISTILINDDIVIATFPGEPFIQLQLDWKKKVEAAHPFLFGYTWHQGTWPNYVPDIKSAALGGYGADQSNPKMIEVGSGEAVMNKHLENMYRLTGLMREEPGPVGFKAGPRWQVIPVPRDN